MVSTRLQVLDFVHDFIARWRHSPSLGEIAEDVGISRKTASKAVASLVESELLLKRPGARGLALPDQRDTAIHLLSTMGFQVIHADQVVTKSALLTMDMIEYIPPRSNGGRYGGQGRKKTGTGAGQGGGAAGGPGEARAG